RILKLGQRQGDAAPLSIIELVDRQPRVVEPAATTAPKKKDEDQE
ncbi:MAG: 50S ribosomal protein L17, partial [Deltaproteobacteria bacterium]|nr:50S ribosomal protein L17 [Deltaproteobacteria bacterium]